MNEGSRSFMTSILLFPFHSNRATTLPLPVPPVLGEAFLYEAHGAPCLLQHGLQGQRLLLCPTNPHSAGTKSISPMTCTSTATRCCSSGFSCSPQLLHLPTPAVAEPHPHGTQTLVQAIEALTLCREFWGSQKSRAACDEHEWYCSALSFIHGKKSAAVLFS